MARRRTLIDYRKEILAAGTDAYFTKPFAMAELVKALEGRRSVRARK